MKFSELQIRVVTFEDPVVQGLAAPAAGTAYYVVGGKSYYLTDLLDSLGLKREQLESEIKSVVYRALQEGVSPAGMKQGVLTSTVWRALVAAAGPDLWLPQSYRDEVCSKGLNPIRFMTGYGCVLWGAYVFNEIGRRMYMHRRPGAPLNEQMFFEFDANDALIGTRLEVEPVTVTEKPVASTPAATWRVEGEADPHGSTYDCERAALCMGKLTDDELANGAYMNYDVRPPLQDIIAGTASSPIAWMTAVKDRIRWLSRKLVAADQEILELKQQLATQGTQND